MSELKIERIGGLAGIGLANSRLKSLGSLPFDQLSATDKKAVKKLFAAAHGGEASQTRDGFTYRITWHRDDGVETIDVPESAVPTALTSAVRDELE